MHPIPRFTFLILFLLLSRLALAVPTISVGTPPSPVPGATVSSLSSITITFSEAVTGVDAGDLLINADEALLVTGSGAGPYVFTFTQPPPGTVNVNFDGDHGIAGQAGTGAFAGASWTYTLTDTVAPTLAQTTPATGATVGTLTQMAGSHTWSMIGCVLGPVRPTRLIPPPSSSNEASPRRSASRPSS